MKIVTILVHLLKFCGILVLFSRNFTEIVSDSLRNVGGFLIKSLYLQVLTYCGQSLNDEQTIQDVGIVNLSTVNIISRVLGGKCCFLFLILLKIIFF